MAVGVILVVIMLGQGMWGAPAQQPLHVLDVDNASASSTRCPSCVSFIDQYADGVARDGHQPIWIERTSWGSSAASRPDPYPRSGLQLRQSLASADVIFLRVGDEQSLIAIREDSCDLVAESTPCSTSVGGFATQLEALLTTIDVIRQPDSRLVVVAAPDPHQRDAIPVARVACDLTRRFGGICVDAEGLVASNQLSPTDWHGPTYELSLDQAGHDAVAHALLRQEHR